jgi:hypothetical protein
MKKVFSILGISLLGMISLQSSKSPINPTKQTEIIRLNPKPITPLKLEGIKTTIPKSISLVEAMIQVESGGNDSIIGDKHIVGGEAVGCLQIRPIMVREINRQLKRNGFEPRFTMDDRYSRDKSIEMFNVYVALLHEGHSDERISRCWNGGPQDINANQLKSIGEKYKGKCWGVWLP